MVNQYFMGEPIDSFTFFRIPKVLFADPAYKDLSTGAKLLYSLMLDRVMLSTLNEWKDKRGRVFIYFTIKEIMREIECCRQTSVNLLDELEKTDLIERKKQGMGRSNRICVKRFESDTSRSSKIEPDKSKIQTP